MTNGGNRKRGLLTGIDAVVQIHTVGGQAFADLTTKAIGGNSTHKLLLHTAPCQSQGNVGISTSDYRLVLSATIDSAD